MNEKPGSKCTRYLFRALIACACLAPHLALAAEPLHILATGVFATTLRALAEPYKAASGATFEVSLGNAGQIAARATAGEAADLVMSSSASIATLEKQGVFVSDEVTIGKMRLGVAVPANAPIPNLKSTEAFRSLLSSARKVAYIDPSGGGTSGPFFEKMLASMGIADAVHGKAILGKDGITIVEAVASGNADVGMTQASEIIGAKGVKFAGFIPDALNVTTVYSAAIPTHATNIKGAAAFLAFIAGPTGAARLHQAGWERP